MLQLNIGVTFHNPDKSTPGYLVFAPGGGNQAYLVDYDGKLVNQWEVGCGGTNWCYLRPNGHLFMNELHENRRGVQLTGSGVMREYDWAGNLVWEHHDPYQHHDARRLEHGGVVYLADIELSPAEQKAIKGGIPGTETEPGIVGEVIREVDADGQVVWEWNFNELEEGQFPLYRNANRWSRAHTNTVQPLAGGQYLISCKVLNLIFILDKETRQIVWYYQNDAMSGQHDAQMLENGNILLFANGAYAADLHHSQVWEINPTTNEIVWRYKAKDNPQSFFSPHVGGCQRLPSGNTLICEGAKGCLFEVTPEGEVVWEYVCPYFANWPQFGNINWLFRARHYTEGSTELSPLFNKYDS